MSTATASSPRCVATDQSLARSAFRDHNFEDPYLSGPSDLDGLSLDPPEFEIIPATVHSSGAGRAFNDHSLSPSAAHAGNGDTDMADSKSEPLELDYDHDLPFAPSGQDILSPSDPFFSDLSGHSSPAASDYLFFDKVGNKLSAFDRASDCLLPVGVGINTNTDPAVGNRAPSPPRVILGSVEGNSLTVHRTSQTSQLLSPELTDNPSPSSEFSPLMDTAVGIGRQASPQRSRLASLKIPHHHITSISSTSSPQSGNFNICPVPEPLAAASPIVKVSSYSRGDSPTREDLSSTRPGRSSNHLSPVHDGDMSDWSEGDYGSECYPMLELPASRSDDGSWIPNPTTGQAGISPTSRADVYVLSPTQVEEERQRAERNADIESWSASVSAANSEAGDSTVSLHRTHPKRGSSKNRRRAKSVGDQSPEDYFNCGWDQQYHDSKIPGPGLLIDERSDAWGYSDSEFVPTEASSQSRASSVKQQEESPKEIFPPLEPEELDNEAPLPHQFLRPWNDSLRYPMPTRTKLQPQTSNDAISRFTRQVNNIETASRSATWGTGCKMTDSEANNLLESSSFLKNWSISKITKGEGRNILKLLPKRSNSNSKRKMSDMSRQSSFGSVNGNTVSEKDNSHETVPKTRPAAQRKLSFSRASKSPSMNTVNAVVAMSEQMAAFAGRGSIRPASPSSGAPALIPPFKNRNRSKSDVPKSSKRGLMELMTRNVGPPIVNFVSALSKATGKEEPVERREDTVDDDDEDDDEAMGDKGVTMDFALPSHPIIPTLDGFKDEIRQLNPRIQSYLIDRLAMEQVRRYKKLVQEKIKHAQAVSSCKCGAGKHCFALGGEATFLPPRMSARDPSTTCAQFQISGNDGSGDDSNTFIEGAVTAALFPPGVPLPPVKRLPAEFECTLCFKVKKFHKPSDWTKHVHEDVQPFTCTFPQCTEPKSFKRKADWVRHENERHRQLEWWTCNMPDCRHKCFRKDNFVQHLVREHKKPEPRVKKAKSKDTGTGVLDIANAEEWEEDQGQEVKQLWAQVDECHGESAKQPQEESCVFCGNVCNSWKKLTVHLAKHMEQIAMPVLKLVEERAASTDKTINVPEESNAAPNPVRTASPINAAPHSNNSADPPLPYSTNMRVEQGASVNMPPAVYYTRSSGNPVLALSPAPDDSSQYAIHKNLSRSSEALTSYNSMSQYQQATVSLPRQTPLQHPSQIYAPIHQNSVTYPPPYNAVRRQEATNQAFGANNSYGLTVSTISSSMVCDPQQPLFSSPTSERMFSYQKEVPSTVPFENSGGVAYPAATNGQENVVPSGMAYMQGSGQMYPFYGQLEAPKN